MFLIHLPGHKLWVKLPWLWAEVNLTHFYVAQTPISPPAEAGAAPMPNSGICAEIPTCPSDKNCLKKWALLVFRWKNKRFFKHSGSQKSRVTFVKATFSGCPKTPSVRSHDPTIPAFVDWFQIIHYPKITEQNWRNTPCFPCFMVNQIVMLRKTPMDFQPSAFCHAGVGRPFRGRCVLVAKDKHPWGMCKDSDLFSNMPGCGIAYLCIYIYISNI